jgi:hypothetical protein
MESIHHEYREKIHLEGQLHNEEIRAQQIILAERKRIMEESISEEIKIMEYEILVFEHNSMYDSCDANYKNVVKVFVETCRKYVNPEYVEENSTEIGWSNKFVSYADRSGNDKPMLVILIGTITDEMLVEIKEGLKKLYVHVCEDCGNEMVLLPKSRGLVCNNC